MGVNEALNRVAAIKVINLTTPAQGRPSRKELEKEVKVHRMMKHQYVLEFIDAVLVEEGSRFVPGLFMLLELAAMGDLFDKISEHIVLSSSRDQQRRMLYTVVKEGFRAGG